MQQVADHGLGPQAAFADVFRIRAGKSVAAGHCLPGGDMQGVGIHHDAVEVEQKRLDGSGVAHRVR